MSTMIVVTAQQRRFSIRCAATEKHIGDKVWTDIERGFNVANSSSLRKDT